MTGPWTVAIAGPRGVREVGGAPDYDEATGLADDERRRLRLAWADPAFPWDRQHDGTWHAPLTNGRTLIVRPPR
jgi:hypothetical protein